MSRWCWSPSRPAGAARQIDLFDTPGELQARGISLIAQTGLRFDLGTPQGKLIASLMSVLAEFERDPLRERVRSGGVRRKRVLHGCKPLLLNNKLQARAVPDNGYAKTGSVRYNARLCPASRFTTAVSRSISPKVL